MGLRARVWPGLRTRSIWFEVFVALLSGASIVLGAATPEPSPLAEPLLIVGGGLLTVLLVVARRRAPLVPFVVSVALAAFSPALTFGVLITTYAVGRYLASWPVRIGAAVLGFVAVAQPWSQSTLQEWVGGLSGAALAIVLPGALGIWQRTRAELVEALRERAERAEAERGLLARDAVLTERTRIAREMHDAVGHRVSLMVLQAGAIEMAAADRPRVEQLAGQVQTAGRQALDELRQAVGVLRSGDDDDVPLAPQPGLADVGRLVAEWRAAGMPVTLHEDSGAPLDPAVSRAAYRVIQEALTNAGKHAPGAPARVELTRTADAIVLRVVNGPGGTPAAAAPGGGYGLVGLRERVRTLGGRISAGPRLDGGFAVEAVLPDGSAAPGPQSSEPQVSQPQPLQVGKAGE